MKYNSTAYKIESAFYTTWGLQKGTPNGLLIHKTPLYLIKHISSMDFFKGLFGTFILLC